MGGTKKKRLWRNHIQGIITTFYAKLCQTERRTITIPTSSYINQEDIGESDKFPKYAPQLGDHSKWWHWYVRRNEKNIDGRTWWDDESVRDRNKFPLHQVGIKRNKEGVTWWYGDLSEIPVRPSAPPLVWFGTGGSESPLLRRHMIAAKTSTLSKMRQMPTVMVTVSAVA